MTRFIVFSFLMLGWAFFELSGGADFVPGRASGDVTGPVVRLVAGTSVIVPDPVKIATIIETPEVTRVAPVIERGDFVPEAATDGPAVPTARPGLIFGTSTQPIDQPPVSLASLERGSARFARPLGAADPVLTPVVATADVPAPQRADIRAVSGRRVNMRDGPGTSFAVLTSLGRGEQVEILDDSGSGWLQLRPVDGGPTGWMAASLIGALAD